MWISPKPERTRFLSSSHPIPPAPTIKIFAYLMTLAMASFPHSGRQQQARRKALGDLKKIAEARLQGNDIDIPLKIW